MILVCLCIDFNSTKVRLKLGLNSTISSPYTNFNSTKVRLKLYHQGNDQNKFSFQFH